jgi:hypothetical protein
MILPGVVADHLGMSPWGERRNSSGERSAKSLTHYNDEEKQSFDFIAGIIEERFLGQ